MVDVSFCIFKGQKGQAVCFKGQEKKVRNKKKLEYRSWHTRHCRFLVPGNTKKILTEIWHQFLDKNVGENICHWNYFQIPQALSELPANWPSQFSQKGCLGQPNWLVHIRRFQEYLIHIHIFIGSTTLQFLLFWYQNGVNILFLVVKPIKVTSGFILKSHEPFQSYLLTGLA